MFADRDKEISTHTHTPERERERESTWLFCLKIEGNHDVCNNTDETEGHHLK